MKKRVGKKKTKVRKKKKRVIKKKKYRHFALFKAITGVFRMLFVPIIGLIYSGNLDFILLDVDIQAGY